MPKLIWIVAGCALVLGLLGQAAAGQAQVPGGTGPRGLVAATSAARDPVLAVGSLHVVRAESGGLDFVGPGSMRK